MWTRKASNPWRFPLAFATETEWFYFSPQKNLEFLLGLPFLFRFDQAADLGNTDS